MAVGKRVTLHLSFKAEKALNELQARTNEGITQVINDALRLYELVTQVPGTKMYIELPPDFVPERIHLP